MKILMLGDSPLALTGFGKVNNHAAKAFLAQGWSVASVTGMQHQYKPTDLDIEQFVPDKSDPMGLVRAIQVFEENLYEPDLIYLTGDPGSVATAAQVIPARIPVLAYVPIEGEPLLNAGWRAVLSEIDFFTCSQYGVDVVNRDVGKKVDFVYHGVDKEFTELSKREREEFRARLGWNGRFVVTVVAQNVRRKQLTRLIEAIAILKHQYGVNDILLYMHTVPFQSHWLDGWNLPEVAEAYRLGPEVVFNPLMSEFGKGTEIVGTMEVPGLRELMGASDLMVLPSQIEGFGLPIAEAMAVGLPVAVTKYGAGWEVAQLGGGTGIEPYDYEIHKSGTRYANLDPSNIARVILSLKRNPRKLAMMSEQGLAAVKHFDWTEFEDTLIAKAQEVRTRHEARGELQEQDGQGREEAGA